MQPPGSPSNWEQQVFVGPAKPLSLYLCSHGHLNRNMGMERPRAPYFTANELQRHYCGCVASASSLPFPRASSVCRKIMSPITLCQALRTAVGIYINTCPQSLQGGACHPHSSQEPKKKNRVTNQDTCVCAQTSGTSLQEPLVLLVIFSLWMSSLPQPLIRHSFIEHLPHKEQHSRC